jgi:GT2 family glycosyltransferase
VRVTISIIIPTFNRPRQLETCLAALAESKYPRECFEVIVVDDGGMADLRPIITAHQESLQLSLTRQPRGGPAAARNAGAALAQGALLAFTDDDCLPDPSWIAVLARQMTDRPDHLVGGATVNLLSANPFSAASQHLISYLYEYSERQQSNPDWTRFFASNNMALPADGFARVGGFDAEFPLAAGEDRDFCDRWLAHGMPMAFAPDARVLHAHRLSFSSFWRQQWNYGRGAFHFSRSRARRGEPPVRRQPLSFYLNLVRYPFGHESWPRAVGLAGLLALSQGANALGYYYEKQARRSVTTG